MASNVTQIKGLSFPIYLTNGSAQLSSGLDLIKSNLFNLLGWPYFTKIFQAEYGSRLWELLEEPNDEILDSLVYSFVQESIERWVPQIELLEINVARQELSKYNISLSYYIKELNLSDDFTLEIKIQ